MNARFRIAAAVALATLIPLAASAQYSNEFTPAKLIKQGTTSKSVAGSGTVVVQVQVNPDGSHKVVKVIRSTRSGDNAAAMEIAQNSSYRPAHRGSTPVVSFYDFTLKFNGKIVATTPSESGGLPAGGGVSPAASQVASLIRQGQYQAAVSKAQTELLSSPGDESLRGMLGIAAFDAGDSATAAAAFDKMSTIGPQLRQIAAASFARAAVDEANGNAAGALAYANKAMALASNGNSLYALGVAQLASKQNAAALQSLEKARDELFRDPKFSTKLRIAVDQKLIEAYLASGETAKAQTLAAEIKQLDPSSTAGATAMGASLLTSGVEASNAKNLPAALSYFDKAAALGDPQVTFQADVDAAQTIGNSLSYGGKPDYKQMQAYAEKALAIKPDDASANFAEGVALTAEWTASQDSATKKKATDALNKADQEAKAQGNESLSLQIETFMKKNLNATGSGGS